VSAAAKPHAGVRTAANFGPLPRRVAPGINKFPSIFAKHISTPTTREELDSLLWDLGIVQERVTEANVEYHTLVALHADSKFRAYAHQHGEVATAKRRLDEAVSNYTATHQATFLALAAMLPSETKP
jgi:hypothetical protein